MSAAFLASAIIQFVLGLVVAWLVGASTFGLYALALAAAIFLQTLGFEWLRLGATRFHHGEAGPALKHRLFLHFRWIALGMAALSLAALAFGGALRWLLALVPLLAITGGYAELRAALLRAEFRERRYLAFTLLRSGFAALALPIAAVFSGRAEAVLLAFLISVLFAALLNDILDRKRDEFSGEAAAATSSREILRYSAPIILTNLLYLALFFALRMLTAATGGLAAAGQISLALDFTLKLFSTIGSALDLALFQFALRDRREKGDAAALDTLRANAALIAAILSPMALGLALVVADVEPWLVGPDFRGGFAAFTLALLPGIWLHAMIQYSLHPPFQLRRETGKLVLAAAVAFSVAAFAMALGTGGKAVSPEKAGLALGAGMLAAAMLLGARGARQITPGAGFWLKLGVALLALATMVTLVRLALPAPWAGAAAIPAGIAGYGAAAWLLDLAGLRVRIRRVALKRLS